MPLLKLAARLELDRTRSVARLDRDGLVLIELGSNDNRVRAISITEAGVRKLFESFPLWMMAKTELQNALGASRLKDFRRTLHESIDALTDYR
jgi:DNA-binding MarR family transcriptional regulator